jgi:integrase
MALYKRGGIWWCTFTVAGKRVRRTTRQTNDSKARSVESMLIAKAEATGETGLRKKAPLLRDFLPRFLDYNESRVNIEPKTKKYYASGAKLLGASLLASMSLDAIKPVTLDTVSFGGSPSNENMGRRTLSKILAYARDLGVSGNQMKVPLVKELGRDTMLTYEQEVALLSLGLQPLSDVLLIMLDTGLRPNEVLAMRKEHIHWELGYYQNPKGKTASATRRCAITARITPILARREKNSLLFEGVTIFQLDKQFAEARTILNLPKKLHLYCARRTWATEVGKEVGLSELMLAGGWSSAKMALHYQQPGIDRVAEAVNSRNESRLTVN